MTGTAELVTPVLDIVHHEVDVRFADAAGYTMVKIVVRRLDGRPDVVRRFSYDVGCRPDDRCRPAAALTASGSGLASSWYDHIDTDIPPERVGSARG